MALPRLNGIIRALESGQHAFTTFMPPDLEAVFASVGRTGRLLVAHEDRVFASLGRELQGAVVEHFGERHVVTRVVGQDPVPGMPQNAHLEEKLAMNPEKVIAAVREVLAQRAGSVAPSTSSTVVEPPGPPAVLWTPNRHFVA